MKTYFSNAKMLVHVWAQQNQEVGNSKSASFYKESLRSHGKCVAKFISNNRVIVLDDARTGSGGWGGQDLTWYIKNSLHEDVKILYVDDVDSVKSSIESLVCSLKDQFSDFKYKRELQSYIRQNEDTYARLMEVKDWFPEYEVEDVSQYLIESSEEYKEKLSLYKVKQDKVERTWKNREEAIDKVILQESATAIEHWKNGKSYPYFWNQISISYFNVVKNKNVTIEEYVNPLQNVPPMLRIKGDYVETSKGAEVPIREAKILLERIRSGKDVKGFQIGHFTVISLNGVLKVGCHQIPREEIDDFCTRYNW